jgi:ketosteroid isomerase-like protein
MRTLVLSLALLVTSSAVLGASEADIRQVQEQWRNALTSADVTALGALFSDDLVYVHSDGRVQTKEQFLAPIKAGNLRFESVTSCDTPRIRAYQESAVVSACYELKIGTSPLSRHIFLTAYAKQAGSWHIVAIQTTRLPEK